MKDVSQQVAEDDDNLKKVSDKVEKADKKIAKYDGREAAEDLD